MLKGDKQAKLAALVRKRRQFPLEDGPLAGCFRLADFADAAYECDFVSPWSRSAHDPDAMIMIVGQDWASADFLNQPPRDVLVRQGYDPKLQTNRNLQALLRRHFGVSFEQTFATNAFPFIKPGRMDAPIKRAALDLCVKEFLLPQIDVVAPALAVCLGKTTFDAVRRVEGLESAVNLDAAIGSPLKRGRTLIACVAHAGARGTNMRGVQQVGKDWQSLKQALET